MNSDRPLPAAATRGLVMSATKELDLQHAFLQRRAGGNVLAVHLGIYRTDLSWYDDSGSRQVKIRLIHVHLTSPFALSRPKNYLWPYAISEPLGKILRTVKRRLSADRQSLWADQNFGETRGRNWCVSRRGRCGSACLSSLGSRAYPDTGIDEMICSSPESLRYGQTE